MLSLCTTSQSLALAITCTGGPHACPASSAAAHLSAWQLVGTVHVSKHVAEHLRCLHNRTSIIMSMMLTCAGGPRACPASSAAAHPPAAQPTGLAHCTSCAAGCATGAPWPQPLPLPLPWLPFSVPCQQRTRHLHSPVVTTATKLLSSHRHASTSRG